MLRTHPASHLTNALSCAVALILPLQACTSAEQHTGGQPPPLDAADVTPDAVPPDKPIRCIQNVPPEPAVEPSPSSLGLPHRCSGSGARSIRA